MEHHERETKRARDRYLRRVGRLLPMKPRERSRLLAHLRLSVGGELPDGSYEELQTRFGEPEEMAASCAEGWTARELLQIMRIRQHAMRVMLAAALAVLLAVGGFFWVFLRQFPIEENNPYMAFEVVSEENLSDRDLDAIIHHSPEYVSAFETKAVGG